MLIKFFFQFLLTHNFINIELTFFQIKYEADPEGGFRIMEGSTLGTSNPVQVKKLEIKKKWKLF